MPLPLRLQLWCRVSIMTVRSIQFPFPRSGRGVEDPAPLRGSHYPLFGRSSVAYRFAAVLAIALGFASLASAGTSNSLLDLSPDGKVLLAANADNASVTVIDTATRKA